MFNYLKDKVIHWDSDISERSKLIEMFTQVYRGTIYNHLNYYFFEEKDPAGNYIPFYKRQPSVKPNFCKKVVDDSVALLFGKDHFPKINCVNDKTRQTLEHLMDFYAINGIMSKAAKIGSTGSVCILIKIVQNILNLEPKNTKYFTPTFSKKYPGVLDKLVEKYKVKGRDLISAGYGGNIIEKAEEYYWFEREFNETSEIYYIPYPCQGKNVEKVIDKQKSFDHNLGFVPAVWIKNLPQIIDSDSYGQIVDGACTFPVDAVDTQIEIHYQLSQAGRALRYSGDPLIIFKLQDDQEVFLKNAQPVSEGDGSPKVIRSASNALVLNPEEEAKMLEISGEGTRATLDYVRQCREYLMETIHGNRSNADKVNIAQSAAAMKALNQALIWLADDLRISYGENGLLKLLNMIIKMVNTNGINILINNELVTSIEASEPITLSWPKWYPNTPEDNVQEANALKTLGDAGFVSRKTGVQYMSNTYDVENIENELKLIDEDEDKLLKLNPQVRINQYR